MFVIVPLALLVGCGSSGGKTTGAAPAASASCQHPTQNAIDEGVCPSPAAGEPDPAVTSEAPIAPETTSPAEAFATWWEGGGQKIFGTLESDLTALGAAAGEAANGNSQALEDAAVTLKADVDTAQQYDPMPDASAQTEWAAALAGSGEAATDYITGAANEDASSIYAGTAALATSTSHMKVVNAFIKRYQ